MALRMKLDEVKGKLTGAGYDFEEERLPNKTGTKLTCAEGEIVLVYDSGSVVLQGSLSGREGVEAALKGVAVAKPKAPPTPEKADPRQTVFVVYGHDHDARDDLELILRRWHLEPLILDQLPSEGATIIEKLEKYTSVGVHYAVVLATPDDEGHARGKPDAKSFRARQNVVLELGMLLAKLGRDRVAILLKTADGMEKPSDIDGLIYIGFKDKVAEARLQLAKEMSNKDMKIDAKDL